MDVGFNNLIFSRAGVYTASMFTDATTGLSTSADIQITGGAPTHLVFTQEPSNASTNFPFEPPVIVTEEDANNDPSTLYVCSITLSIASPDGVALNGTVTATVQNGAAVFDTVSIPQAGNNYTLSAVDSNNSNLTATSTPFNVVTPVPLYVDISAPAGGDGLSWSTAYQSLQSALAVAILGDVISAAQGDYSPGNSATSTFTLLDGVTIQGGFASGGSVTPKPASNLTTLDGLGTNYHVVTGNGVDSSAILDGFTIAGGNASGSGDAGSAFGGGLLADGGSPTISSCIFTSNAASNSGGAVYVSNASPTLINCLFFANSASQFGGAVYDVGASPTFTNCTFTANTVGIHGSGFRRTILLPILSLPIAFSGTTHLHLATMKSPTTTLSCNSVQAPQA